MSDYRDFPIFEERKFAAIFFMMFASITCITIGLAPLIFRHIEMSFSTSLGLIGCGVLLPASFAFVWDATTKFMLMFELLMLAVICLCMAFSAILDFGPSENSPLAVARLGEKAAVIGGDTSVFGIAFLVIMGFALGAPALRYLRRQSGL